MSGRLPHDFGLRLARARKEKGLSQEAFAEIVPCSQRAVQKWEGGHAAPHPRTLPRLAEVLDVSVRDLTGLPDADQLDWIEATVGELLGRVQHLEQRVNELEGDG